MNILVTTGIFPPDVGGPAKFVPLIADKLSEKNNLKVITLSEKTVEDSPNDFEVFRIISCLLYTSPSPRDGLLSRMPSSA